MKRLSHKDAVERLNKSLFHLQRALNALKSNGELDLYQRKVNELIREFEIEVEAYGGNHAPDDIYLPRY